MMRLGLAVLAAVAVLSQSGCTRAQAFESFTLEDQDQLIAETPGCEAECTRVGKGRTCVLKDPACRAVCRTIPECRPAGERPLQVCAVIRGRP